MWIHMWIQFMCSWSKCKCRVWRFEGWLKVWWTWGWSLGFKAPWFVFPELPAGRRWRWGTPVQSGSPALKKGCWMCQALFPFLSLCHHAEAWGQSALFTETLISTFNYNIPLQTLPLLPTLKTLLILPTSTSLFSLPKSYQVNWFLCEPFLLRVWASL